MKKMLVVTLIMAVVLLGISPGQTLQKEPDTAAEKGALSVMMPIDGEREQTAYKRLASDFERANQTVAMGLQFVPRADYWKHIFLNYSQHTMPDVLLVNNTMLPALCGLEILLDLDEQVERLQWEQRLFGKQLTDGMQNGSYYGIPFAVYTYGLYCNLDLLEKYGLKPPKTLAELMEVCEELVREPADSLALAAAPGESLAEQMLQLLYLNGATLRSLKSEEAVEIYQMLADMVEERMLARDCVNWNAEDLARHFALREVALMINDLGQVPLLEELEPDFKWTVVELPDNNYNTQLLSNDSLVVTTQANAERAMRFLEFSLHTDQVKARMNELGSLPILPAVQTAQWEEDSPYAVFAERMEYASPLPSELLWQNISQTLQDSVIAVFEKEERVEQIVQTTYDAVNTYILDGK